MRKLLPAMRVSLGLIMVVVAIIMMSDLLGIIPDRSTAVLDGRKKVAETLAVQYSLTARNNDYDSIAASMTMLVEKNEDVLSAALRSKSGRLIAESGDHDAHWDFSLGDKSTPVQMQVPIYRNALMRDKWGTVELRFRPLDKVSLLGFGISPLILMTLFVAATGFVVFLVLIKKIFTSIDPSSVVPGRVKRALDTLMEGVLLLDSKGRILFMNRKFNTVTGISEDDLVGKRIADLGWSNYAGKLPWAQTLENGEGATGANITLVTPGQADSHFTVNSTPVLDEKGLQKGVMVTFDDVTELETRNNELRHMVSRLKESSEKVNQQNEELRILATHDPLTNCKNRRFLFDNYAGVYQQAVESQIPFSCIMLDIDHFKRINDNFGHVAGDEVLRKMSGAILGTIRQDDEVFRYGGEEFCILLPGAKSEEAAGFAERLRRSVEKLEINVESSDETIQVTSSFGISSITNGADSLSDLIDQADMALYYSKNNGRNRVSRWYAGLGPAAEEEILEGQHNEESKQAVKMDIAGLPDRKCFKETLSHFIEEAEEGGEHVAVLLVDLDKFQRINNLFGHAAGDSVLESVAQRLSGTLRVSDPVTRVQAGAIDRHIYSLGGDEFGILLTDLCGPADIQAVTDRILEVLGQPFDVTDQQIHLSVGIGISQYPCDSDNADTLITNAAVALQQAKQAGGNTALFFRNDFMLMMSRDYEIEKDLRHALQADEFELYFQPQLDIKNLRIKSMEALIRWNHPQRGMVPPDEFIPVAESSGLIVEIGQWVINAACRQVRDWLDSGVTMPVSINISAVQFHQEGLVDDINSAVSAARINPECLELEITESTIMDNMSFVLDIMQRLKKLGYRMSIDDFGTGYSSLEYLKKIPATNIKIDRSFINQVNIDPGDAAIVRAAVTMAHGMDMRVIAEGVENEEQLFFLRNIDCDMVQGFLLGRPLPAGDAIALLDQKHDLEEGQG